MRKDLKVVYEFELRTNNRHSCMEYMEGLAHDVTYLLWNCICRKMKLAVILHFRLYWSLPQKTKKVYCCRKIDGNKIFDISELFQCYFEVFFFHLFSMFFFLCFIFLYYVFSIFLFFYVLSFYVSS